MTASISASDSAKSDFSVHDIPALENEQEARVQAATLKAKEEEREALKAMNASEQMAEEKLRAEAKEELMEYKTTELTKILADREKEAEDELKAIDADSKKNTPKLASDLAQSVLDFTFISNA